MGRGGAAAAPFYDATRYSIEVNDTQTLTLRIKQVLSLSLSLSLFARYSIEVNNTQTLLTQGIKEAHLTQGIKEALLTQGIKEALLTQGIKEALSLFFSLRCFSIEANDTQTLSLSAMPHTTLHTHTLASYPSLPSSSSPSLS